MASPGRSLVLLPLSYGVIIIVIMYIQMASSFYLLCVDDMFKGCPLLR